jgi:N-acetylmuramic acid 6-phosphate etherase
MARARASSKAETDFAGLPTEAVHPEAAHLDEMPAEKVVALMVGEEARAARAAAARAPLIGRAAELVAARLAAGGRLVYVGAGTSGRLGTLDATECVPTFGVPPSRVVAVIAGGPGALTRSVEAPRTARARPSSACAASPSGRATPSAASPRPA